MRALLVAFALLLVSDVALAQDPVPISLPDTVVYREPGQISGVPFTVPVHVGADVTGRGIQSVDVVVSFDPAVVSLTTFTVGDLVPDNGCAVIGGTDTGEINVRIACGSSTPLAGGPGALVTLEGTLVAEGASALTLVDVTPFNEGGVEAAVADGRLRIVTDPTPRIEDVDDQQIDEDMAFTVELALEDDDTDPDGLTVTAEASTDLFGASDLTVGFCEGQNETSGCRTLTGVPAPDASGVTTITLTVSDNDSRSDDVTESFEVTVAAVNDAPRVAAPLDDRSARAGTDPIVIDLASVFVDVDGETPTYTASSSDPSLATTAINGSELSIELIGAGMTTITARATDGAGLFVEDSFELTLSSGVANETDAPGVFTLRDPAPNPVTASTELRFDLPRAASVRADVFDSVGRRVLSTPLHRVPAGSDRRVVLALDDQPSGVYLYRLIVDEGDTVVEASGQLTVVR